MSKKIEIITRNKGGGGQRLVALSVINSDLTRKVITEEPHFLCPFQLMFQCSGCWIRTKLNDRSQQHVMCLSRTNCVLQKCICWHPNPSTWELRSIWDRSFKEALGVSPNSIWSVTRGDKDSGRHQAVHTEARPCADAERRRSPASQGERPPRRSALPAPYCWTFVLERNQFWLSQPVWGTVLQQLSRMNTVPQPFLRERTPLQSQMPSSPQCWPFFFTWSWRTRCICMHHPNKVIEMPWDRCE